MKIADILTEKTALENLAYKKKAARNTLISEDSNQNSNLKDIFNSDKKISADITKINQLEKSYLKDNLSLNGLFELQNKVNAFESSAGISSPDYNQLSHELSAIVNSTKYNGENIISYLSTNIQDRKSLYTFKSNLDAEITNTQTKLADERKNLAQYLVKQENLEVARDFSSDKTVRDITQALNKNNSRSLFKEMSNVSSLLGLEK